MKLRDLNAEFIKFDTPSSWQTVETLGRWTPSGTGIDDQSFVPGSPPQAHSILQEGHAHFFITNGEITDA